MVLIGATLLADKMHHFERQIKIFFLDKMVQVSRSLSFNIHSNFDKFL